MVSFEEVINNDEIAALIESSGAVLRAMSYTEHGNRHARYVSKVTEVILNKLGCDKRIVEIGKIAGYLHDVGNSINRHNHGISGANLLYPILYKMGMPVDELCLIISAIGNHEEEIGSIVNDISAALVIADKSDAHRARVCAEDYDANDIHDRVNNAIRKNYLEVNGDNREISSRYYMDDTSSVMEYFEIYLNRITMSEQAAHYLKCTFKLFINDVLINSPKKLTEDMLSKIVAANKLTPKNA